ncbi:MAG: ABC transporter substrate-binding protein, partial [Rubrobacter sp.]
MFRKRRDLTRREFLARGAALGVAATGVGGVLSACGGGTGTTGPFPVTIPIHTGPWLPSYERVARMYEEETGNEVRLLPLPLEQLLSKQLVDADTEAGDYSLYTIGQNQAAEFWDAGFITPFAEVDTGFEWPEGILEYGDVCRWDAGSGYFSKDGTVLGLPVVGLIETEFYRGDLYEKLDIEGPPETWEGVISASKKAKKKLGSDFFGYLVRGERNGASWNYLSLLMGFGGDVFADPPNDWSVTIGSDRALAATEQWLELASYGPPGTGSVTQSSIIALMMSGDALHTHLTPAAILPFDDPKQSALPGKIDATVVPRPEGGEHAPTGGIWINAIPAHISEERKRAAYDFLSFFVGERAQTEYAKARGIITNRKVYESELVREENSQRALQAINESTPYIRRGIDYVFAAEVVTVLD